jgi:hypothetical protein
MCSAEQHVLIAGFIRYGTNLVAVGRKPTEYLHAGYGLGHFAITKNLIPNVIKKR